MWAMGELMNTSFVRERGNRHSNSTFVFNDLVRLHFALPVIISVVVSAYGTSSATQYHVTMWKFARSAGQASDPGQVLEPLEEHFVES